jgi:hypothetical protein
MKGDRPHFKFRMTMKKVKIEKMGPVPILMKKVAGSLF